MQPRRSLFPEVDHLDDRFHQRMVDAHKMLAQARNGRGGWREALYRAAEVHREALHIIEYVDSAEAREAAEEARDAAAEVMREAASHFRHSEKR